MSIQSSLLNDGRFGIQVPQSGRTILTSNPNQRRLHQGQLQQVGQQVKDVVNIRRDNFDPKRDRLAARVIAAVAITSAIALAIFAFIGAAGVLNSAAIAGALGGGVILLGGIVGGVALWQNDRANDRLKDEQKVDEVADSAWKERIGEKLLEWDDQLQQAAAYQGYFPYAAMNPDFTPAMAARMMSQQMMPRRFVTPSAPAFAPAAAVAGQAPAAAAPALTPDQMSALFSSRQQNNG